MFNYPKYEVDISRHVRVADLSWPEPGEAAAESGLGCNRAYMDLRRLSWTDAGKTLGDEARLIARIENAEDPAEEYYRIEDEYDASEVELCGLDVGVASTVIALSAARCVPFSSCNAGTFGGNHHEAHPVVAFYAKPETANLLLKVASETGIGLESSAHGWLVLFSHDVRRFPRFAEAMIRRRKEFNALRLSTPKIAKPSTTPTDSGQYQLPL